MKNSVFDETKEQALEELRQCAPGSTEFKNQAEGIAKVIEAEAKLEEARNSMRNELIKGGTDLAVTAAGGISAGLLAGAIMKFEETGAFTSKAFQFVTKLWKR